jgi:hypothetical protein
MYTRRSLARQRRRDPAPSRGSSHTQKELKMKKTYSRPVLAVHGSATEKTQGLQLGINHDFTEDWRRRVIP